jgi:iron complex transport system substrate-binding protein
MDADVRGSLRRRGAQGAGARRTLRRARRLLAVAQACALALAACADTRPARDAAPVSDSTGVVVDAAGRSLRFEHPPQRVLSLVPAVTVTLVQLGAAGALVGRTDYDTIPEVRALPSVGGGLQPDLERLLTVRPDLVILFHGPQDAVTPAALDQRGIPYLAVRPDRVDDVRKIVRQIGQVMGRRAAADSLVASFDDQLADVRARVVTEPRLRVAFLLGGTPPWVAGPGTFVSELLDAAGADNAFADQKDLYAPTSMEVLLSRPVDAYVVAEGTSVSARLIAHARVIEVPADVESPGTGLGRSAEALARALHPAAFR